MSPSANDLEEQIGRPLQNGDILVTSERTSTSVSTSIDSYYEVTNPSTEGRKKKFLLGEVSTECVEVRNLTPYGPTEGTVLYPKDEDWWSAIVKEEDRTDKPSLRER